MTTEPSTSMPTAAPSAAVPATGQAAAVQPALPAGSVREDPWPARLLFQVLGDTATFKRFLVVLVVLAAVVSLLVLVALLAVHVSPSAADALGPLVENPTLRWVSGTVSVGGIVTLGVRAVRRRWTARRGTQAAPPGDGAARSGSRAVDDGGHGEGWPP